ncbi:MAG: hypothetical protein JWO06_1129 [Bacteroidota bacterium]|nr:hypothetical protein [Bacteroidota bacterium]
MPKKINSKVTVAILIVALLVGLELIFHRPFFGSAKDKIYELLHQKNTKVTVKDASEKITSRDFLKKYFDVFGYKQTFSDSTHENDKYRDMLIQMLNQADSLGLDRKDYHQDYIARYDSLSHLPHFDYAQYESENELIFTDAALSFLYHVAYGKEINTEFNGVNYNIDSARILRTFSDLLTHRNWRKTLDSLEPRINQYVTLKSELNRMGTYLKIAVEIDTMSASAAGAGKVTAVRKLRAYGFVPDEVNNDSVTEAVMKAAVKGFQKMMSVDTTGKLDDKTLTFLNFPIARRVRQIKESLNYWRWTGRLKEREFVMVNIPAARLQIIKSDSTKDISMKVIVGKLSTKTPSFTAYITKVIAYPYWTVPFSIATKEMLPKIRKRLSYLEDNNLQVINGKGEVIDPQTVGWTRFSEHYFPYTIRQGTGCDNSLGVLKFDLNSPFSIYLHDTDARGLFSKKDRFLSHGCVRLEKPMVLAEYVLKEGLDTAQVTKLEACMRDQKQSEFKLKRRLPVLILYMTADVDENGNLKFYNDVYGVEEKKVEEKKVVS